jgi:ribonuclease BN (tRNA processing enzyme)
LPKGFSGKLQHLTAEQAGASARQARVENLLITHLWPNVDAERSRADASDAFGRASSVAAMHGTYIA